MIGAENNNKIELKTIFEKGYEVLSWNHDNQASYTVTITNIEKTFLSADTTCFIANGLKLPDYIKHYIDDMITQGKNNLKVHFSFKIPGIIYRQSLFLRIQIAESN